MHLHPLETAADSPPQAAGGERMRTPRPTSLRRRLLWFGLACLVLALLALTPPLVNANRYRNRIAQTMSDSLGRPVHLDNVSMHLLPVPGFTLQNLVVSEDPAFGAEPTIRANVVEATLRVSSLWHRPVEFSAVRFVEPSVNLVRNAEGRWNLSDVLLQASRVQSAPTNQRHAGPTPRFPYIEATGGRVNVKLGAEKLPFSLTDADFALWSASPGQWRVRLVAQPARTDTNITDPGRVRFEGSLRRAATAAAVPVDFRASWHDAPLGEVTRILAGEDLGWRGSWNLDATLSGTLGEAQLGSKLTLGGLRRAEFFPAQPLDLQITCGSGFALRPATLTHTQCRLPDGAPEPLQLRADELSLQQPEAASATLEGQGIPARWALLWAALFSARVPTDLHPGGTLDVALVHSPAMARNSTVPTRNKAKGRRARLRAADAPPGGPWAGAIRLSLPAPADPGMADPRTEAKAEPPVLTWNVVPSGPGSLWPSFRMAPTTVEVGPGASLTLAGSVGPTGYSLSANGSAPAAALLQPARYLPQLADGLDSVLPFPPTGTAPARVQITCARVWGAPQRCTGLQQVAGPGAGLGAPLSPLAGRRLRTAPLLVPRNLSPLEGAPFATPRTQAVPLAPR